MSCNFLTELTLNRFIYSASLTRLDLPCLTYRKYTSSESPLLCEKHFYVYNSIPVLLDNIVLQYTKSCNCVNFKLWCHWLFLKKNGEDFFLFILHFVCEGLRTRNDWYGVCKHLCEGLRTQNDWYGVCKQLWPSFASIMDEAIIQILAVRSFNDFDIKPTRIK